MACSKNQHKEAREEYWFMSDWTSISLKGGFAESNLPSGPNPAYRTDSSHHSMEQSLPRRDQCRGDFTCLGREAGKETRVVSVKMGKKLMHTEALEIEWIVLKTDWMMDIGRKVGFLAQMRSSSDTGTQALPVLCTIFNKCFQGQKGKREWSCVGESFLWSKHRSSIYSSLHMQLAIKTKWSCSTARH